ncbi:O-antigen ligase family protein [Polynucleobacter sp. AP-Feld-500C-C5]|uniref:O-antigen ligase family protein n=1 Tax=Polynucleobacter sp. AP-Feld-500C-C5 TaxID=2576924 RepID=UPI001C0BE8BB|nr:O-antigen ligase family protein [Polynucleobacter sp. AP-Feld-500C-C5]MBU3632859.1 O-antigen ligase family protein [Polynucleobacter sp. AP-Feld-500C-C5]
MNDRIMSPPNIPGWMVWVQCICFSVLYAIWALPETILIRHICLIIGALLSLWTIYQYRHSFFQWRAIPVWLIVALFAWATFHLFFLANDFAAQYAEYSSIWKRSFLCGVFGLGFGLSAFGIRLNSHQSRALWPLIYCGLVSPIIVYLLKYFLTRYGASLGWNIPDYLKLYYSSAPYYIPKTAYVCFCLPALAISLGNLLRNIKSEAIINFANLIYLITVIAVLYIFYKENIKNGIVYGVLTFVFFIFFLISNDFKKSWKRRLPAIGVAILVGGIFLNQHIKLRTNDSWRTLLADARVALDVQTYSHWKHIGTEGYPNNEGGSTVSFTNYDRIAWGKVGLGLIYQNPMGYGLIEGSFGKLAKKNWSDSKLTQSHSGWIDFALGMGIIGVLLLSFEWIFLILSLRKGAVSDNIYNPFMLMVWWALISLFFAWITTELSQKIYFDSLILWLSMGAGCHIRVKSPWD